MKKWENVEDSCAESELSNEKCTTVEGADFCLPPLWIYETSFMNVL